jgi:hypothetical protein
VRKFLLGTLASAVFGVPLGATLESSLNGEPIGFTASGLEKARYQGRPAPGCSWA